MIKKRINLKANILKCMSLIIILVMVLSACSSKTIGEAPEDGELQGGEADYILRPKIQGKGYSLSPRSFSDGDFQTFLDQVQANSEVLRWGGVIDEVIGDGENTASNLIQIARNIGVKAVIDTEFYETPEAILAASNEDKQSMIDGVAQFAKENKPDYLGLGTEINHKLDGSEEALDAYQEMFARAYEAIKAVAPETQVFITFQYEWMNGLQGGIFGGVNDINKHQFDLLEEYNMADFIGFTTYPGLIFYEPEAIPYDYYDKISDYTDLPIGFTEIGWFSHVDFGEQWESDEAEQAEFVETYFERTSQIKPVVNIWAFMYEFFEIEPFTTMSFFDDQGKEKAAFSVWENISRYPEDLKPYRERPLYFMSRKDRPEGELYEMDIYNNIKRLTYNEVHENNVALSNDGTKLAYHGGVESDLLSYDIYILDMNRNETTRLTDNNILDGHPDWSPDDKKLIYAAFDDGNGKPFATADLYTIDVHTKEKVRLTDSENEENDPEFSPNGELIVYKSTDHSGESAKEEIYIMNADGSNQRRLTNVEGWVSDHDPSWSKSGGLIIFERFEGTRPWFDVAVLDNLLTDIDHLTPWNIYAVNLSGKTIKLNHQEGRVINFLPVFIPDDEMQNIYVFIQTEFYVEDELVVGTKKRLMFSQLSTTVVKPYVPYYDYFDTIEYFDF